MMIRQPYILTVRYKATVPHMRSIPGTGEVECVGSHVQELDTMIVINDNYTWNKEAAIAWLKAHYTNDDAFEYIEEVSCIAAKGMVLA